MKHKNVKTLTTLCLGTLLLAGSVSLSACSSQTAQAATQQITSSQELMAAGANSTSVNVASKENPDQAVPAAGESVPLAVVPKISKTPAVSQSPAASSAAPAAKAQAADSYIGEAKAKEIALNHAGVKEDSISGLWIKLDYDDGRTEYEVEFYAGNKEYDYDIDAVSGEILHYDYDIEYDHHDETHYPGDGCDDYDGHHGSDRHHGSTSSGTVSSGKAAISAEEAKKLALSQVPGASAADIRLETDHDHGRTVYEGKIVYNGIEYEFEIDGTDGTILEWEAEHDHH